MRISSLCAACLLCVAACHHVETGDASTPTMPGTPTPDAPMTEACNVGPATEPNSVATTRGLYRGQQAGEVIEFLGMPYAAPPIGAQRWRPPAPAACFDGVRDAKAFGAQCMQLDPVTQAPTGSEDCLFVNVWTPALDDAKRPVLFWVHGGANVLGSANQQATALSPNLYDGQALATREQAVVVSINYRLGAFGFLAHPLLEMESAHGASGNYALHDQLAALAWVKADIERFGGDPDRVMLFGESAGAMNTGVLLASPLATGLFSRALMESGDVSAQPRAQALSHGSMFADKLGCADLDCLRQLSAETILNATSPFSLTNVTASTDITHGLSGALEWAASVDGWLVPDDPMQRFLDGAENKVPLVIGSNAQEMALFLIGSTTFSCAQYEADMSTLFGANAPTVIATYPCAIDGRGAEVAALTDLAMTCPARRIARAHASAGAPTYRYYFSHAASYGATIFLGAYHASELQYVFNSFTAMGYVPTPGEVTLSQDIEDYWGAHARAGAPNAAGLPTWPQWTTTQEDWLAFDSDAKPGPDDHVAQCAMWASILGW